METEMKLLKKKDANVFLHMQLQRNTVGGPVGPSEGSGTQSENWTDRHRATKKIVGDASPSGGRENNTTCPWVNLK